MAFEMLRYRKIVIGEIVGSNRLTIYLLKDVSAAEEAIAFDKNPTAVSVDTSSGIEGTFFHSSRPSSRPAWVAFVQPLLAGPQLSLTTSSASGLLVLKVDQRFFGLTFGYGRSFLDLSKVEHQFGLKVALNRIDPRHIRSLDTKTFEDMVVTKNTQASKSSELPTFGVDVSRDMLRAVTGEPRDRSFAKRLSGSDALVVNLEIAPADLPKLCGELLVAFGEDSYKADFEWIDHLALVSDGTTTTQLNELLEQQLIAGDTSNTHMALPEAVAWEDIDVFKIGGTRAEEYDDLDLDDYLNRLGDKCSEITIDRLKTRSVSVRFSRSNDFDARWNLYQCLVTEQRLHSKLHVLIEGRWFVVSDSLVAKVDQFATSLAPSTTSLIASQTGEVEADYNSRLAATVPGDLLLLDAKIKRPGGATSGIEVCDVLASSGEFIHVKRKSRSSTLSHLFAQGTVSATTFVADGSFRDEIRSIIANETEEPHRARWLDLIPEEGRPVDRSKYSVSYVVIANSKRSGTDWLPFFSKLNLMQNGQQLLNLGFSVSVSRVNASD
ncbi:TIGR04141 family sporadically distributed protein [Pseudarthrobacter sp. HLT3-5]|uniref:DUF6119 family protein n=1 Tax=Pseudarthrobacter cellobiosi TaxID=2953654 RepID=UPI00208FFAC4|nr:DUF6119 family protein [Pseudarthrobacter sp. HLT3-5]MCO4275925.1 TIGR04141 family sporadically distributed protein [Pseudarthrobacter sp. HLT3-5]